MPLHPSNTYPITLTHNNISMSTMSGTDTTYQGEDRMHWLSRVNRNNHFSAGKWETNSTQLIKLQLSSNFQLSSALTIT